MRIILHGKQVVLFPEGAAETAQLHLLGLQLGADPDNKLNHLVSTAGAWSLAVDGSAESPKSVVLILR